MPTKDARYFRTLPYTRRARPEVDADGAYFVAYVAEIPSIRIDGSTREEALLRLDEVFDDLILALVEEGVEVPEPQPWPGGSSTADHLPRHMESGSDASFFATFVKTRLELLSKPKVEFSTPEGDEQKREWTSQVEAGTGAAEAVLSVG